MEYILNEFDKVKICYGVETNKKKKYFFLLSILESNGYWRHINYTHSVTDKSKYYNLIKININKYKLINLFFVLAIFVYGVKD